MQDSSKQLIMTLYHIDSQRIDAQVLLKDDTIWATQKTIAEIFGVDKSSISKHIANIFNDGELLPNSTIAKIAIVQREGNREVSREIEHYNLDMIISVGYRVNSKKATHFRIWATNVLKEFTLKVLFYFKLDCVISTIIFFLRSLLWLEKQHSKITKIFISL